MWRGNYEIEEKELPSELNMVAEYISNVKPGKINLFYGCRNNNDYLYKKELEFFKNNNILSELYIAMSRINNEKIYVTNYIYEHGNEICKLILDENASIYICGDGNQMTKDVEATIKKCLIEFRKFNKDDCDLIIKDMKNRKKYLIDVWS
jgi:sulfite reductase alpha subunit-like flavoprotein